MLYLKPIIYYFLVRVSISHIYCLEEKGSILGKDLDDDELMCILNAICEDCGVWEDLRYGNDCRRCRKLT